jgi:hypothetical protein
VQPDAQFVVQQAKQNRPLVRRSHFNQLSEPTIFLLARTLAARFGYLSEDVGNVTDLERR